ncbi:MAG: energy transducer TonB [Ferruginibacter sp.]
MKQTIEKLSLIFIAGLMVAGCNNNDTVTSTETTSDTSVMSTPDTNHMMAVDTMATTAPMDNTNMNAGTSGMATPNPAKKGKKGKATVTAPAVEKNVVTTADNSGTYTAAEVMPVFPGGYKGMQRYFDNTLTYPEEATNQGVEGTVMVNFIVDENGKLISPTVSGNKLGYGLEEEALRVVSNMPAWTPGTVKGKKVKTKFNLPVRFQIE